MNSPGERIQEFFTQFAPYAGFASDLDGTGYDTEWYASRVTSTLTLEAIQHAGGNPFAVISQFFSKGETQADNSWLQLKDVSVTGLTNAGMGALTDLFAEYVCLHYSGRSVEKQVPMIELDLGITLPSDFIDRKKAENLRVLGRDTTPIAGFPELLQFVIRHRIPFACLTASPPDRVQASMECSGLDRYLSISGADGKIPVISTEKASVIHLAGHKISIPKHAAKPAPDGYIHTADEVLRIPRQYVVALEDSGSGVKAAGQADHTVGLVVTGGHFPRHPDHHSRHVEKLKTDVGHNRHFVINSPRAWTIAVKTWINLAVAHAEKEGAAGLNGSRQVVDAYVDEHFAHLSAVDELRRPGLTPGSAHTLGRRELAHSIPV